MHILKLKSSVEKIAKTYFTCRGGVQFKIQPRKAIRQNLRENRLS